MGFARAASFRVIVWHDGSFCCDGSLSIELRETWTRVFFEEPLNRGFTSNQAINPFLHIVCVVMSRGEDGNVGFLDRLNVSELHIAVCRNQHPLLRVAKLDDLGIFYALLARVGAFIFKMIRKTLDLYIAVLSQPFGMGLRERVL